MKTFKKGIWFLPLVLIAQLGYGQLLQVNQTVFGMDCAPCAYGVEKGLQKLPGVNAAKVSLNKGKALITLNPVNNITLLTIRKNIIDNGFSPRDAEVKMKGSLKRLNGEMFIQVQSESFWINPKSNPSIVSRLSKMASGSIVTISGQVNNAAGKGTPVWQLDATKVL